MRLEAVPALALLLVLAPSVPCRGADGPSQAPAASAGSYILSSGQLRRGDLVPRFQAVDIYGVEVDLEKLLREGKHPLLAFWSMYCKSCVDKFDAMTTIQNRYASQGLVVISINTDGEYRRGPQMVRDFIADYERRRGVKANFPILYDERNWVAQAMNVEVLPTIITVDEAGRVGNFYQSFGKTVKKDVPASQQALEGLDELVRESLHLVPSAAAAADVEVSPSGFGAASPSRGGLKIGAPVPLIRARGILGRDIDLRGMLAQRSKIMLVFWSMYCQSCIEKMRALVAVQERFGPEGVKIISVNTDGEYGHGADAVKRFIGEFEVKNRIKVNFPVLYDEKNPLPQALQIEFLPTIVTVDPDGCVLNIYQKFDESSDAAILAGIEGIVREMLERFAARAPAPIPGAELP